MIKIQRGVLKGRSLPYISPELSGVRPFTGRMRKSLMDILTLTIEGACMWDLFCGSGIVGIEALSLGAGHVFFVDQKKRLLRKIDEFLRSHRDILSGTYTIERIDLARKVPESYMKPDIVVLDPPYAFRDITGLLDRVARVVQPHTQIFLHTHRTRLDELEGLEVAKITKIRNYGEARLIEAGRKENV